MKAPTSVMHLFAPIALILAACGASPDRPSSHGTTSDVSDTSSSESSDHTPPSNVTSSTSTSTASAPTEADAAAPAPSGANALTLDGIYTSTGTYSWTAFHDGTYTFWSSDPACSDASTAPSSCVETGTFKLDLSASLLTMTEATTGKVWTATLSGIQDPQTGARCEGCAGNNNIANYNAQSTQEAADWKAMIYLLCQLATGGSDPLPEKPTPPPPPPITSSCSSGGKPA